MRWMRLESLDNSLLRRLSQKYQTFNKLLKRSRVQDDFLEEGGTWRSVSTFALKLGRKSFQERKLSRARVFKGKGEVLR